MRLQLITQIAAFSALLATVSLSADEPLGTHGFASSDNVKIHYVTAGNGPLVILIHGFPDYWYTWRKQMPELAKSNTVVAIDQRGFNRSGQPEDIADYALPRLVDDVAAVIRHFDRDSATIVGHDWGGAVAWTLAMTKPELVDRLVILNLPHLHGLQRELANNPDQQNASAYARRFQQPDAAASLTAEGLTFWVTDSEARPKYVEAFRRSSFEGMLNYYKANYPKQPYVAPSAAPVQIKCPVLMIHGLKDTALLPGALNDTWKWLDHELTLVTLPNAGHFVQQDESDRVTTIMATWLATHPVE